MKLLFVNACSRKQSRTLQLCQYFIEQYKRYHSDADIEQVNICEEPILPMNEQRLLLRDELIAKKDWNHELFRYARQWNQAERVIIGAPYWDWSFPSVVKVYIENIVVSDLNFIFQPGRSKGLCKGEKMVYITTAGGNAEENMGYDYVKRVLRELGEYQNCYIHADLLDVDGIDQAAILEKAKKEIDAMIQNW